MSGRIVLQLDKGLGWTAPLFLAVCGDCGTELARSTDQATAERAAARRLPGTTSLNTDLALARGRREFVGRRRTPDRHSAPRSQRVGRR